MNILKNKTYILASLAMITLALTGCSKNNKGTSIESDKEIHIRVWETKNGVDEFIKQAAKAYTEKNPNVVIDYVHVSLNDMIPMLEADGPNDIGPDIIASPHDNLGKLVSKKLILPTENASEVSRKVLGACSKALTYGGKMYGYPACAETYALFYNKKLISENEVPKSWEELIRWVQNFNRNNPNKLGFVMDVTNGYYSILFTTANGNRLYGESGTEATNPNMNTPAAVSGMKLFQSLRTKLNLEGIELSSSACDGMFSSGNAAMHITGLWNVSTFEKAGIDFGVAPIPSLPGESKPASSFSGTRGMFVTSYSKHPKEAADFAAFLITPEMQQLRFELTGVLPSINTTVNSKYMAGFLKQLDAAFPMPSISAMGNFWGAAGSALWNIWNGADVQAELDSLNIKCKG